MDTPQAPVREERDFTVARPELPSDLAPAVRSEVEELWGKERPWTELRPIKKGTDNLSGACCEGSVGNFHLACDKPVVAVQYNVQGIPQFYCEQHGIAQDEWDDAVYRQGPPKIIPMTRAQEEFVVKLLTKKKKMKEKEEDYTETDLMA